MAGWYERSLPTGTVEDLYNNVNSIGTRNVLAPSSKMIMCEVIISKKIYTKVRAATPSPLVVVPPSDMHRLFSDLLATEDGADVTFKVAGKIFTAHRYIHVRS